MKRCAIILAAGRGSRMGSLTNNQPKGLIGKPGFTTVESQLSNLAKIGVDEVTVVTGYLAEQYENLGVATIHNNEWNLSNMVYSLSRAYSWAKNFDQIIMSYSDIFFQIDALKSLVQQSEDIALVYDINWLTAWKARFENPLVDLETFKMDTEGNLTEIGKKTTELETIQGQYMGLLSFSKKGFQSFFSFIFTLQQSKQKTVDMTSALNLFNKTKLAKIKCIPYSGSWGEIDSRSDYELYFQK